MIDDVLRLDVSHLDGRALVTTRGDVDSDSVLALQAVLDELSLDRHILIDMAGVRFIDSSGVNVLINQSLRMAEEDGSFYLRNASVSVRRVLEITGLERFFLEPAVQECASLAD